MTLYAINEKPDGSGRWLCWNDQGSLCWSSLGWFQGFPSRPTAQYDADLMGGIVIELEIKK